ncbi:PPE domain-containing protein, partial [Mycobacteroides abscessus]
MPGVDYGARTPDMNSVSMWGGPGAGSFMAAAGVLTGVAGALSGLLAAHGGVAAQTGVSWMGATGATAVAAQTPYMAWLGSAIALVSTSAVQIEATAAAFETARAATPTPGEVAENQAEHVALNAANFMGFLTPAIVAN